MPDWLRLAFSPPAEPGKVDTGLRFTDVLFGFVIRELFTRLQNWSKLAWYVRWHLILGTALVLGSWIGFRRSLNRTTYEVKFFNLPFFRFLADQLTVILYFRVAVLTQLDGAGPGASELAKTTLHLLVVVFALYVIWDLLAVFMATTTTVDQAGDRVLKYRKIADGAMTAEPQPVDLPGLLITVAFLVASFALAAVTNGVAGSQSVAVWGMAIGASLLLAYRFAKEVRTSCRSR